MYIGTYMSIHFLLEDSVSVTVGCPEGRGSKWTYVRWGWHRRGHVPLGPAMDVLELPQVPSWTRLLRVGAEHSASWSTIAFCPGSPRPAVYEGIRCQRGVSVGWDWGRAPLSPPRWQRVGAARGAALGSLTRQLPLVCAWPGSAEAQIAGSKLCE